MRFLILLCCLGLISSCVVYTGPSGERFAAMGTDARTVKADSNGLLIEDMNQSRAVKVGGQTLENVTRLQGLFSLGNTAIEEVGSGAEALIEGASN